jgi:hypothetical protein
MNWLMKSLFHLHNSMADFQFVNTTLLTFPHLLVQS